MLHEFIGVYWCVKSAFNSQTLHNLLWTLLNLWVDRSYMLIHLGGEINTHNSRKNDTM